jgi:adenylate cyclase
MPTDAAERKLAAILSADVVGYSRLMAENEAATVRTLSDYREEIGLLVRQHRGRVVDTAGDSLLAEFPTATDAVSCAVDIQGSLGVRNATLTPERRMEFRIGIHLGEVRVEGERIYGDGVNIAARLEGLAEAGGVCISATVHEQVRHKLELGYEDLGEKSVKNIPDPIRVYRIRVKSRPVAPDLALPGMEERTVPGFHGAPAIAVLPFDNLSGDPEQEYFADGIAEDLITRLSRQRWLPVIARNSSFVYKGKAVDVKQVSRELGVRYVVKGSVRKAGDRVRISAQLIEATTSHHVWAERYDRELRDVFAVQDEITEAIMGSIAPQLQRSEWDRAAHMDPENLDAWDCASRAMWHYHKFERDDTIKAREFFQRAAELDPNFAGVFSGLAATHYLELMNQWTDSPARSIEELSEAARRSVALDNTSPLGQVTLAFAHVFEGQREKAEAAFERALQLSPSYASGYFMLGLYLARWGRPDEAIEKIERAVRLSPQDPMMHFYLYAVAVAHFVAERYEEGVAWAQRSLQDRGDYSLALATLAASLAFLGRVEQAQATVQELLRLVPGFSLTGLKLFLPAADPDFVERYLDGLRKAGLPE